MMEIFFGAFMIGGWACSIIGILTLIGWYVNKR
jgi:hypothetical protein